METIHVKYRIPVVGLNTRPSYLYPVKEYLSYESLYAPSCTICGTLQCVSYVSVSLADSAEIEKKLFQSLMTYVTKALDLAPFCILLLHHQYQCCEH